MKNPLTGEIEPYAFESSYTVAPPSANVTPTKMNVMYKELENPISVAAPGFTDEQIVVEVANGELVKREGELSFLLNKVNMIFIKHFCKLKLRSWFVTNLLHKVNMTFQ